MQCHAHSFEQQQCWMVVGGIWSPRKGRYTFRSWIKILNPKPNTPALNLNRNPFTRDPKALNLFKVEPGIGQTPREGPYEGNFKETSKVCGLGFRAQGLGFRVYCRFRV